MSEHQQSSVKPYESSDMEFTSRPNAHVRAGRQCRPRGYSV